MSESTISVASTFSYNQAAQSLGNHGCVILPTETVYGLATRADNHAACERLYAIKGRDFDKPLPVCVLTAQQAGQIAHIDALAAALIKAFWPGPLTLVLPVKDASALSPLAQSPSGTVALRNPDCEWARYLDDMGWQEPLALTSANASGAPSPQTAKDAHDGLSGSSLKSVDIIIDDGPCSGGVESTIIEIRGGSSILLRSGALKPEAFAAFDMNWTDR